MSALDDAHATIRRLRSQLRAAEDERDSLAARLAYALEEVRQLRARVPARINQAAAPR